MDIFDTNEPKKESKEEKELHNELEDIILNKKDKSLDIKKIALIGGSVILLLLIVISIVKIFSQKPQPQTEDFFASAPTEEKSVEEKSFEQVPIIKEETKEPEEEKFEKLVQEVIKEKEPQEVKKEPKEATKKEPIKEVKKEIPQKSVTTPKAEKKRL